jgi:hypothetical protein
MKPVLLASAAALCLSGAAFAQDPAPAAPKADNAAGQAAQTQANAAPQSTVSDSDVQKVAALAADVKALNTIHQPKIAAAGADATAKAAAQKDLDTAIQASLTKHGLSVDRYNEIAKAAAADKALAARIAAASSATTGTQSPSSATAPARE